MSQKNSLPDGSHGQFQRRGCLRARRLKRIVLNWIIFHATLFPVWSTIRLR